MNKFYKFFILILIFLLSSSTLQSQTSNMQTLPSGKIKLGLSFDKIFYKGNTNYSTFSGVYQFDFSLPVNAKFTLISNVPYVNINYNNTNTFYYYSYKKGGIGNIFIGLQTNPGNENKGISVLTFGTYLPSADVWSSLQGLLSDYYNIQKFTPNSVGLYFNYAYHYLPEEGFAYGFEAGPNFFIPTKGYGATIQMYIHYAGRAAYNFNSFTIDAELLGIGILTGSGGDLGDRFIHQVCFSTKYNGKLVSPGLYYRFYLNKNISNYVDGVLGAGISVSLNTGRD